MKPRSYCNRPKELLTVTRRSREYLMFTITSFRCGSTTNAFWATSFCRTEILAMTSSTTSSSATPRPIWPSQRRSWTSWRTQRTASGARSVAAFMTETGLRARRSAQTFSSRWTRRGGRWSCCPRASWIRATASRSSGEGRWFCAPDKYKCAWPLVVAQLVEQLVRTVHLRW